MWTGSYLMGIIELVGTFLKYKPNYRISKRKQNFTKVFEQKDFL